MKKLIVKDSLKLIGRGNILVVDLPDELREYSGFDIGYKPKLNIGNHFKIENKQYEIKGIEFMSYQSSVGILFRYEDQDFRSLIGKEIEIIEHL